MFANQSFHSTSQKPTGLIRRTEEIAAAAAAAVDKHFEGPIYGGTEGGRQEGKYGDERANKTNISKETIWPDNDK
jgi:hypothetical protein